MTEPVTPPAVERSDEDAYSTEAAPGDVEQAGSDGSMPFESSGGPEAESNAAPGERGAP